MVILFSLIVDTLAAAENEPAVEKTMLTQLMQALSQNNYKAFISGGTEQFKSGLTKSAFDSVVKQLGGLTKIRVAITPSI